MYSTFIVVILAWDVEYILVRDREINRGQMNEDLQHGRTISSES